jgi:hypothetical protein
MAEDGMVGRGGNGIAHVAAQAAAGQFGHDGSFSPLRARLTKLPKHKDHKDHEGSDFRFGSGAAGERRSNTHWGALPIETALAAIQC